MSFAPDQRDPVSPDDVLPPVEPPSAGFILQLFVVPGVIVLVIVLVWMLFTWISRPGDDPKQYIAGLQRPGPGRWQVASNLANALRDKRYSEDFKRDDAAARQLAQILEAEIEAASYEEKSITLRMFLARALGEFYVPEGLPVLLKAATTERDPAELDVRRSAVEGLALLAENISTQTGQPLSDPQLAETLQKLARDEDAQIRVRAAFALGVWATPAGLDLLDPLLRDANPDVRYNAATGLARHGRVEAIPVLVEMLDAEEQEGVTLEKDAEMRPAKRLLILVNALRAARMLAQENPQADLAPLVTAATTLQTADVPEKVQLDAQETAKLLREK